MIQKVNLNLLLVLESKLPDDSTYNEKVNDFKLLGSSTESFSNTRGNKYCCFEFSQIIEEYNPDDYIYDFVDFKIFKNKVLLYL